jgi:hypothetical protein
MYIVLELVHVSDFTKKFCKERITLHFVRFLSGMFPDCRNWWLYSREILHVRAFEMSLFTLYVTHCKFPPYLKKQLKSIIIDIL